VGVRPTELELIQPIWHRSQCCGVKWGARVLLVRSVSREEVWASAGVQGAWVRPTCGRGAWGILGAVMINDERLQPARCTRGALPNQFPRSALFGRKSSRSGTSLWPFKERGPKGAPLARAHMANANAPSPLARQQRPPLAPAGWLIGSSFFLSPVGAILQQSKQVHP